MLWLLPIKTSKEGIMDNRGSEEALYVAYQFYVLDTKLLLELLVLKVQSYIIVYCDFENAVWGEIQSLRGLVGVLAALFLVASFVQQFLASFFSRETTCPRVIGFSAGVQIQPKTNCCWREATKIFAQIQSCNEEIRGLPPKIAPKTTYVGQCFIFQCVRCIVRCRVIMLG